MVVIDYMRLFSVIFAHSCNFFLRDFVSEYAVTGKDAVGFLLDGGNPLGLVLTTKLGVGQWY